MIVSTRTKLILIGLLSCLTVTAALPALPAGPGATRGGKHPFTIEPLAQVSAAPTDWVAEGQGLLLCGSGGELRVAPIGHPSAIMATLKLDAPVTGCVVEDRYAYLAQEGLGLRVIDLAIPDRPADLGLYPMAGSSFHITYAGEGIAVAVDDRGLMLLDMAPGHLGQMGPDGRMLDPIDPFDLHQKAFLPLSGRVSAMTSSGDGIFVATEGKGLRVWRAGSSAGLERDPAVPRSLRPSSLAVADGAIIVATDSGLGVVDGRPGAGVLENASAVKGKGILLLGRLLYVAAGEGGLLAFRAGRDEAATVGVSVQNVRFNPSTVNINTGDSVKWTWTSGTHSTTSGACGASSCTPDGVWDSGTHATPFDFTFTFNSNNSYPYFCTVHTTSMTGTVNVTTPSNLAATSSADHATGAVPFTVNFTGGATGGTPPYTWSWAFGDGFTSTSQNPSHTYMIQGSFNAVLTAKDSLNATAQAAAIPITVSAGVQATSSATPTSGFAPLQVTFTGSATGGTPPYTWSWAFGDGFSSTDQNPTHTYPSGGTFHPILTVHDSAGGSDPANPLTISVQAPLNASSSGAPLSGTSPLQVNFAGAATGGTPPYTYDWDFGDGTAHSSTQSPSHAYADPGDYSAVLTVHDSAAATDAATPLSVTVNPPLGVTASGLPTLGVVPLNVAFTGTVTGGFPPYTYDWNFGDGTAHSSTQNPTHQYTSPGTYPVTLTAGDSATGSGQAAPFSINVNQVLTATSSGIPTSGTAPLAVTFAGSGHDGMPPYTYEWDFGDGTPHSSVQNPSHTYSVGGSYSAVLAVTDSSVTTAHAPAVTVNANPVLVASSSGTPLSGPTPLQVTFTAGVSGGTPPYTYGWTFGDGAVSSEENPVHSYAAQGVYSAVLAVHDSGGATSIAPALSVYVGQPLGAASSALPSSGTAPLSVTFSGSGTGGAPPYTYAWTFGDGGSGTGANPAHVYASAGSYTVDVTVTDAASDSAAAPPFTVTVAPPLVATASATPMGGTAPLLVSFTGSASGGTPPFSYDWNFGDGSPHSTEQSPTHTYASGGTFVAQLAVHDSGGGAATAMSITLTVSSAPLSASAAATPTSGIVPLAVAFTGTVSGGTGPYSYSWSFGDGGSSFSENPSHTYGTPGAYSAVLTVTDAAMNSASSSPISIIAEAPLSAAASAAHLSGAAPLDVAFTGSASGGTPPYTYSWAFGDGGTSAAQSPNYTYASAGVFQAVLTVHDSAAASATSDPVAVTVTPALSASSTASLTDGVVPLDVAFSGGAAGGAPPYSFAWSFGDGGTSATQSPAHTFTTAGSFTVTLQVTDAASHTASASPLTITARAPLSAASSATPLAGPVPLAVSFTGSASGGTPPYTLTFNFGDGTSSRAVLTARMSGRADDLFSHTYSSAGTYSAVLTATDSVGGSAAAPAITVTVTPPLSASASASPTTGHAPLVVAFTGSASGGTPPYTWSWAFGDGDASSSQSPSHTYAAANTYTAVLAVSDSLGATASSSATLTVQPPVPPPVITLMKKVAPPFSIVVTGSNLQNGIQVFINGTAWPNVVWKKSTKIAIKGGSGLKAVVPKGVATSFRFVNPDGGEATATFTW